MKTVKCVAQLLASITMLLMTVGVSPASAMTMEGVTAAYERGDYTIAGFYLPVHAVTLRAAWSHHPERFVRGIPKPLPLPEAVWINPPAKSTTGETAQ